MAAELSARMLLLQVRNDFNSIVDVESLIPVFERHEMLERREEKFLGRPDTDDISKKTLLFHKMYNSEETSSPLSATDVIQLFEETKNETNIQFAEKLQSILSTLAKEMLPPLPPFKYCYSLNNNLSAIFSSIGGVLYSPVYGVKVYIPAGAILEEEQVEVSFQLVREEAEIQEFLTHSLFKGSVLCSGVFEFKASRVNAPDGEFTQFHSDVWIEMPHCLSFGGCSLKDYSTAFVVSERRGKVEVEEQALFSEGYPYVNLPMCHFSKFCVIHTPKRRFAATSKRFAATPKKRFAATPKRLFAVIPKRSAATPKRRFVATPKRRFAATPKKWFAATPKKRFAATPKKRFAATPKRRFAATPKRRFAAIPKRSAATPKRWFVATPKRRLAAASKKRSAATPTRRIVATPKWRIAATPNMRKLKDMQKLCISISYGGKLSTSPHVCFQLLKQVAQESANSSRAPKKRALLYELENKASRKVSTDLEEQYHLKGTVEVDLPAQVGTASNTPLQQEPLNVASMSIMARVYQPRKRHKMRHWTADILFAPHLHNTYKVLADFQEQAQYECCTTVFHLELRTLFIQLQSGPSTQGWSVELSTTKILLEHLEKVAPLLSSESGYSSKMADFLPKCTAEVQNHETFLPLRHPIEVERSDPPTHCYLTCDPRMGEDKNCKVQVKAGNIPGFSQSPTQHGPSPDSALGPSLPSSTFIRPTSSSYPSAPFPPQHAATIQWDRDRCILALLSIMIPEQQLLTLGESLGLPRLMIDQAMSGYTAESSLNVGERAYEMFRRVNLSEQSLTFGKILLSLSEIDWSNDLVPILRSYMHSFNMVTSGNPAEGIPLREESGFEFGHINDIPNHFFIWLRVNHPHLIPLSGTEEKQIISPSHSEQDSLFLYLSPKLVCVWRMVGRLLGLTDSHIAAIDAAYDSRWDRESEPCYQMLLKWVQCSRCPSDITYHRLMAALQLTSLGVGAALDAIFYLRHFVLSLASARISN